MNPTSTRPHEWARHIRDSGTYAALSGSAARLVFIVSTWANKDTGQFFLSYDSAAQQTGLTKRSTIRAMNELQDLNLLVQVRRGGGTKATIWRLTTPTDTPAKGDTRVTLTEGKG